MAKKLNRKQSRFVCEYVKDLNGTQAAIRAGYSVRTARIQASQLLTKLNVQQAIEEREAELLKRAEIKQHQVIIEEKYIAFSNLGDLFDENGVLLSPDRLPEHVTRALASIEVKRLPGGGTKYKYKFWDKGKALERLSRHLGLYNDRLQVGVRLEDVLQALPPEFAEQLKAALKERLKNDQSGQR